MKALHENLDTLGRKKMIHRVRSQFYWRGLQHDVANFVRSCEHCQKRKALQPWRSGYLQLFSATEPFKLSESTFSTESEREYAVVMVDLFTRWPELAAIPNATAEAVADAVIDKLFLRHGCPVQLLSDRGAQFTSRLSQRMSKRLGVKKIFTTANHPQTNGQVGRLNRYIATALTAYVQDHQ